MKRLYGAFDEWTGEVFATYKTAEEAAALEIPVIEMVQNFTWETSDWTDENGENWIATDRLAKAFRELCDSTLIKKGALARLCGRNLSSFCRYTSGALPVPRLVWEKVAEFKR